jgi:hypothetical protein
MHCHETKEISFILERQDAGAGWEKGERFDITLGRGDLVVLPPFLQDEVFNAVPRAYGRTSPDLSDSGRSGLMA